MENLAKYCGLAWDWNTKINLTRHTTPELFVQRDLLDSYQLSKLLQPNEEILDLGTGGGVPGILLAILRPDLDVSLCDSVAKKAKVAQDIVKKLGLNVRVFPMSATNVLDEERFDTIVARGVGSPGPHVRVAQRGVAQNRSIARDQRSTMGRGTRGSEASGHAPRAPASPDGRLSHARHGIRKRHPTSRSDLESIFAQAPEGTEDVL